jgi:hypothetical protein
VFLFLVNMFFPNKFIPAYINIFFYNTILIVGLHDDNHFLQSAFQKTQPTFRRENPPSATGVNTLIGTKLHLSHITSVLSFVDTS